MAENDKKKIADRMTKMEDSDQPDAYFNRFEEMMKEAGVKKEEWIRRL